MPRIDSSAQGPIARIVPKNDQPPADSTPVVIPAALVGDSASLSARPAPPPKTDGLTEEEIKYLKEGLLPTNFADLKALASSAGPEAAKELYRQGKTGPFAPQYGDPSEMLAGARRIAQNPELLRMAKAVKKGDIICIDWNDAKNPIAQLTKGPYEHAMICTSDGPPPDFIEAIGMTGDQSDPTDNRVRRSPLGELGYDNNSIRILRPTEGMDPKRASKAIDQAVLYAEAQLGKPYDYTFSHPSSQSNQNEAYYCSELAYKAYASAQGADLNLHIDKSPDRDTLVAALNAMVDSLQPTDKAAMMDKTMKFFLGNQQPTASELVAFLVDNIMSTCKTTEAISKTPGQKASLKNTLTLLMEGKAFPHFQQAQQAFAEAEKAHQFDQPILGPKKRLQMQMAIESGLTVDCARLFGTSGVDYFQAARATKQVLAAFLPYSETLCDYLYGPRDSRTKAVGDVLDDFAWVKDHAPHLPVVGDFGLHNLPVRAKPQIDSEFVSPSDLAWADLPHFDFNVKQGASLDDPARNQAASR